MKSHPFGICLAVVLAAAAPAPGQGDGDAARHDAAVAIRCLVKDPTRNREAILVWQRNRIKEIGDKLGLPFVVLETDHYIVNSTMTAAATKRVANGCEDLYRKMSKVFALDPDDRAYSFYACSWSALEFMIRSDPKKFVKFLHALKAGKSEEEAIREAFGKSMDEFEKAWRIYVNTKF